jgi:hypothetical protein
MNIPQNLIKELLINPTQDLYYKISSLITPIHEISFLDTLEIKENQITFISFQAKNNTFLDELLGQNDWITLLTQSVEIHKKITSRSNKILCKTAVLDKTKTILFIIFGENISIEYIKFETVKTIDPSAKITIEFINERK